MRGSLCSFFGLNNAHYIQFWRLNSTSSLSFLSVRAENAIPRVGSECWSSLRYCSLSEELQIEKVWMLSGKMEIISVLALIGSSEEKFEMKTFVVIWVLENNPESFQKSFNQTTR